MMIDDCIPEPSAALGERARNQHRRMIDRLRREVGGGRPESEHPANSPANRHPRAQYKIFLRKSLLPRFRGEREGPTPQAWEGEVGRRRPLGPPPTSPPTLSAPEGRRGRGYFSPLKIDFKSAYPWKENSPGQPLPFHGNGGYHAGIGAMRPTSSSLMLLTRSLTGAMVIVPV